MSDETFFRSNPVWGNDPSRGPLAGVGPQGPDYNQPRAPQDGEAPELLPQFQGSAADVAKANRKHAPRPAQRKLAPYLTLTGTVTFLANADPQCVLGAPNKGYHWVVRELMMFPGSNLNDNSFNSGAFFVGAFFIGSPPTAHPGAATSQVGTLTDFAWSFFVKPTTVDVGASWLQHQTFGPDQLVVLENQSLYAQVISANSNGRPTMFLARVQQFPNQAVERTEVV